MPRHQGRFHITIGKRSGRAALTRCSSRHPNQLFRTDEQVDMETSWSFFPFSGAQKHKKRSELHSKTTRTAHNWCYLGMCACVCVRRIVNTKEKKKTKPEGFRGARWARYDDLWVMSRKASDSPLISGCLERRKTEEARNTHWRECLGRMRQIRGTDFWGRMTCLWIT